ncbi:hypothetical protein RhiirA1_535898 [Rhizophagus irregularis]|uniref:Uncharacterized protein n=1 Tax=Rhizophagus irregularis TaxID=588596 RepID=A0A2N0RRX6_9GLOM|nr:hypothetical protein RhiirA1_535898 [Rhizophagus irregularis]
MNKNFVTKFKKIVTKYEGHDILFDKSSTEILLNEKYYIIKERTSKNNYIKNIIYDKFLESIPFDRFEDIKQIGEGGIVKAYSETWIDGKANYIKQHDEIEYFITNDKLT